MSRSLSRGLDPSARTVSRQSDGYLYEAVLADEEGRRENMVGVNMVLA